MGVPTAVLEVSSPLAQRALDVALAFDYGGTRVAHDALRGLVVQGDGATMRRNGPLERELRTLYHELARTSVAMAPGSHVPASDTSTQPEVRSLLHHVDGARARVDLERLPQLVAHAAGLGWRVEAERRPLRIAAAQRTSVASGTDWFDLGGEVRFDQSAYTSFEALLGAARAGERWVVLDDGSFGLVPEQWLTSWSLLGLAKARSDGALRFARSQVWLLDAWLRRALSAEAGAPIECDETEAFELVRARAGRLMERAPLDPPATFRGELRDYQRAALGWFEALREAGVGGCLADDMGLGKTVQVLAHLEARRLAGPIPGTARGPMLVVAPRSVVLNLTAADFVLLLDPWWNPAAEAQAIDRAHRIGRTRPVMAYRFVMEGTIEEKVVALQQHKRALADSILAADTGTTLELTSEDLAELLG
jgi:hypothetical protein